MTDDPQQPSFSTTKMDTYPEIESFLQSFSPSMSNLKDGFVAAGITTKGDLVKIAKWGDRQILGYFRDHFHVDAKCEPLKAFPAYSLYMRLSNNSCICGKCQDPLPMKRICGVDPD
ncbi:hypothetical protein B0H14DRAFT_3496586 [Mycena olivaceomarginata]|nr:hypothetical protein B0H14DRAFT_3522481 [Mycena olivaceomarginata]KAJ7794862.1 hypothetical protein B0H14DRAFT_3496586 [Mycena olivaceomarginata]